MISPIFLGRKKDMNADILRQRRNLISASIALSVYQLAGKELTKGSTIFGTFTIDKPEIIISLAWCSLLYFLWRYWMYAQALKKHISKTLNDSPIYSSEEIHLGAFNTLLVNDCNYRKLAKKYFEKIDNEELVERYNNRELSPVLVRGFFNRKLDFSYLYEIKGAGAATIKDTFKIRIPYLEILTYELKAQVLALSTIKSFSDYNLPYFFALAPFCIFLIKNFPSCVF